MADVQRSLEVRGEDASAASRAGEPPHAGEPATSSQSLYAATAPAAQAVSAVAPAPAAAAAVRGTGPPGDAAAAAAAALVAVAAAATAEARRSSAFADAVADLPTFFPSDSDDDTD